MRRRNANISSDQIGELRRFRIRVVLLRDAITPGFAHGEQFVGTRQEHLAHRFDQLLDRTCRDKPT